MEFNITLTEGDYIEAGSLARKEFNKKGSQHTISIISMILLAITFFAPVIFAFVASIVSDRNVFEGLIFALALWIILTLCLAFFVGIERAYSKYVRSKCSVIGTRKYTITTDTIKEETKFYIVETRSQGINDYFENSQVYYIWAPGSSHIFPKKQIEQIAEKDEFYQWINGIKEQTGKLAEGNLTGHRFCFLRKWISSVFRETFIEDSPRQSKDDTTLNDVTKHS